MQEVSETVLTTLKSERLKEKGVEHSFTLFRFPCPDSSGCDWHVMPESISGRTLPEIPSRQLRFALREIFEELHRGYNLEP